MSDRFEALSRRRLLALGGGAVAGSAVVTPSLVRREMDLSASVPDDAWPTRGRTPARTAHTPASGPTPPLTERWTARVPLDRPSPRPFAVADGLAVTAADDTLAAVDADTGGRRWTYDVGNAGEFVGQIEGPPSITEAATVVPSFERTHAVAGGGATWTRKGTLEPQVAVGSVAFARAWNGLVALDVHTGTVHWRATDLAATQPLCFADGTLFCAAEDAAVAVDGATGEQVWSTGGGVGPTATFRGATTDERLLVVGDDTPSVIALDRATGAERWALQSPERASAPAVGDGRLYVVGRREDAPPRVLALAPEDGATLWSHENPRLVSRQPVLADGVLYLRLSGGLLGLDPTDGEELFRVFRPPGSGPMAVADGRLYVAGGERLYALEGSA